MTEFNREERDVLGKMVHRIIERVANDPDAPELLRLKSKITLESTSLSDYILDKSKGFAVCVYDFDADLQPLRDVLEYLRLMRAGAETFFETHKPETI